MTVCANNQTEIGSSSICQAVNKPSARSTLKRSGHVGLLGVPLPMGARLVEKSDGDPDGGVDPRERYTIEASAGDLAAFFETELVSEGWFKDGTSTPTGLFFEKGSVLLGILINSGGGSFTIAGS